MKDLWKGFVILFLGVAILSGCATQDLMIKDSTVSDKYLTKKEREEGVNLLIEPYASLGVKLTPAIQQGKASVIKGNFHRMLFGEYFPGRIRWNVWIAREDGKEYFAQSLFSGLGINGQPEMILVIDGVRGEIINAKGLMLSTMVDYVYNLTAEEFKAERAKFISDRKYRHELIMKHGTRIGDLKVASDILPVIRKWNSFQTPDGTLLSPLGLEEVKMVASINPQYSFGEKLVGTGRFAVTMDPISSAQGAAIDLIRAANAPSTGWDYLSQLPSRRNMGFTVEYILKLYEEYINQVNSINAACIGELEKNSVSKNQQPEKKTPEKISKRR